MNNNSVSKRKIYRRRPRSLAMSYTPRQRACMDEVERRGVESDPVTVLLTAVTRRDGTSVELLQSLGVSLANAATAVAVLSRLAANYAQQRLDAVFEDCTAYPPDDSVGETDYNLDAYVSEAMGEWGRFLDVRYKSVRGDGTLVTFTPAWERYTDDLVDPGLASKEARGRWRWRAIGFRDRLACATENVAVPARYQDAYQAGVEGADAFLQSTAWLNEEEL